MYSVLADALLHFFRLEAEDHRMRKHHCDLFLYVCVVK